MDVDRRLFSFGLATWTACRSAVAAEPERRGVFWSVKPTGAPPTVLFAYNRVAASVTQDILKRGNRLAAPARRLILDMPNSRFPKTPIDLGKPKPLTDRYSAPTVERIHDFLRATSVKLPNPDNLPGVPLLLLLTFEGQTPSDLEAGGSLPGTLVAEGEAQGKPVSYLRSFAEVAATYRPTDALAVDRAVDERVIRYLLTLRDKVGPIGKYMEGLYVAERPYDLLHFRDDMIRHGVPLEQLFDFQRGGAATLVSVIVHRAEQTVRAARKPTFLMLPYDDVVRKDGLLTRLGTAGIKIDPVG